MDRRDFLKAIGLGGIALTIPKPLKIVAATIADLADPPLHAGVTEIGPLPGFSIRGISLSVHRLTAMQEWASFAKNWRFTMAMRAGKLLNQVVTSRVETILTVPLAFNRSANLSTGLSSELPYVRWPSPYFLGEEETVEGWLVATPWSSYDEEEGPRPPLRPLPDVRLFLHGTLLKDDRFFQMPLWSKFEHVRLDRARAIELGLADPAEPEDPWYTFDTEPRDAKIEWEAR